SPVPTFGPPPLTPGRMSDRRAARDSVISLEADWRISIAEIESDGAFSTFPQCDRHIALLDGNGMTLEFDAAPAAALEQRLRFARFDGEWQTRARLHDGPVRDFNVIARRDRVRVHALQRPLVGTMVFPSTAGTTWFVYLAAGRATVQTIAEPQAFSAGESLLLEDDGTMRNCILDGGGDLLLVKLTAG
ncbi:MAG: HutD/Ves family protein, partial [Rudaea sp.]